MSAREQMSRRTPAQQARALIERFESIEGAQDFAYDRLSNAGRDYESEYWERTLRELSILRSVAHRP